MKGEDFLSRWHRRKIDAKRPSPATAEAKTNPPIEAPASARPAAPAALPAIESLTPESDFSPFMQADVAEHLKRRALKTLFQDPRFNVMDGLDVYIDDYSKPDPLPEGWLEKMNQVARLGEYRAPEEEAADKAEGMDAAPIAGSGETSPAQEPPAAPPPADSSDTAGQPSPPAPVKES